MIATIPLISPRDYHEFFAHDGARSWRGTSCPLRSVAPARAQQWPSADADQTLKAMHDELERSRNMQIPNLQKPYFIQYRLLDLDVRTITASFGALDFQHHHSQSFHGCE